MNTIVMSPIILSLANRCTEYILGGAVGFSMKSTVLKLASGVRSTQIYK